MNWNFEPSVVLGIIFLAVLYASSTLRRRRPGEPAPTRAQVVYFTLALLGLVVALVSPLDDLADHYLLSMHMVQHLLLTLVAAPLIAYGAPITLLLRVTPGEFRRRWILLRGRIRILGVIVIH